MKWIPVPGLEELYVTWSGLVGKNYHEKYGCLNVLKTKKNPKGYHLVVFKGKAYIVSRLVAKAFIPNPDNKPEVNHKNGDKDNNKVSNLEWSTSSENNRHSYHVLDNDSQHEKRQVCIFKDGKLMRIAISVREAARIVSGASTNISACCKGERKSHRGYTFKYHC